MTEAGVTLTDDMLCYAREYADLREVARKTLGRDVATNRTYTNENSALVLVRGAEAHAFRLYDPPSHSYHLIADRRISPRRDNNGSSCAPAGASRIRLAVPVERLVHRPGIELMDTH
ncbi:MAG: hypothetical protein AVDCRST_MAG08-1988 [uncultured Acetobacteraceae bacterium]|uniref:Uncharacterized protein n=1 Tax=uncultured Acetobacteraceae bacterium TaxID=169975 RepID=A0A6J4IC99_9PROT|nr:MAG: hypothetical protein AVDCRST_MAG08-1988 [uncultured Acetobacteraceae bacterium]